MSGLQRMIDAMEAGHDPSPATYRDAQAELDAAITEAQERVRALAVLRGRIEGFKAMSALGKEVLTAIRTTNTTDDAQPILREVVMCSDCGEREARVYDNGVGYCKRCAHPRGLIDGKIA